MGLEVTEEDTRPTPLRREPSAVRLGFVAALVVGGLGSRRSSLQAAALRLLNAVREPPREMRTRVLAAHFKSTMRRVAT